MRIALVVTPFSAENLQRAAQIGVTDVVTRYPGHYGMSLESIKDQVEAVGLRLSVVEGYIPIDLVVHGKSGRERQIEGVQDLLCDMGRLGVSICCYNFMPDSDWTRTSVTSPDRGGALTTAFDADLLDPGAVVKEGITAAQLWENLAYFLDRVVPVAEEAGVQLAMHPDDPPMSPFAWARLHHDQPGSIRATLHVEPVAGQRNVLLSGDVCRDGCPDRVDYQTICVPHPLRAFP